MSSPTLDWLRPALGQQSIDSDEELINRPELFSGTYMEHLRIAVIHEWLDEYAGSELVLSDILRIFPDADVFCIVDYMGQADRSFLHGRKVQTTFIQRLPFA